jgi:hypothetical protein
VLTEQKIELRTQPDGVVGKMISKHTVPPVIDVKEPIKLQARDLAT